MEDIKKMLKAPSMWAVLLLIVGALLLNSYNIEQEAKQDQQQEKTTIQK